MIVTINGNRFDFRYVAGRHFAENQDGTCESPIEAATPKIRIRRDLQPERKLEVTIHELLHAARWSMSEESVTQIAADMTRILSTLNLLKS